MKATFDVTIKIDGRCVEAAFGMKDGAEDMDVNVLQIVLKQSQTLRRESRIRWTSSSAQKLPKQKKSPRKKTT